MYYGQTVQGRPILCIEVAEECGDDISINTCILYWGKTTTVKDIQRSCENLKNMGVVYFRMSCVEFCTVSTTGGRSCLKSLSQALVHSSFCGKLMDYNWRKQVRSVHLCSWLTPQAKRVPPIKPTCVQLGCSATSQALIPLSHFTVCWMIDLK